MSVILRERRLQSGTVTLFLDIYHKGKRLNPEYLGMYLTNDRKKNHEIRRLAEAIRAKRELEFHAESEGLTTPTKRRTNILLFAKGVYEGKKQGTRQTYKNAFEHFQAFTGEEVTFDKLTPKLCEQFKNYLLSDLKLKPNSAAAYYERFRSIIKRAIREGIISQSPAIDISIRKTESLPKYLTEKQLSKLGATPIDNETIRDAFFFSCYTGLRYGDVERLNWKQIKGAGIEVTEGKTGAAAIVPLHQKALTILKRRKRLQGNDNNLIFFFPRRSTVDKALKRWATRAGLDIPLSFHKARHTFATLLLSSGTDFYTASKLLGHKNLATTQIYARVIDEKKQSAVNGLPSIKSI